MSNAASQPPQANVNNRVVRGRHTAPQDLEEKYSEAGVHVPFGTTIIADGWTTVGARPPVPVASKPTHSPRTPKRTGATELIIDGDGNLHTLEHKGRKWTPTPPMGPHATAENLREARRVAAFRSSLARLADPVTPTQRVWPQSARLSVREITPITPLSAPVVTPSQTRQHSERKRIKQARASKKQRRSPIESARRIIHAAAREVTKAEAAAPVEPSIEISNPYDALSEPPAVTTRGTGAVTVHKFAGSTHLENNAGRLMRVRSKGYEVVGVKFVGWFKQTLSNSYTPAALGIHIAGDKFIVHIPEGMVESIGAFLAVAKRPNLETFEAAQAFCRSLCRPIDFDSPAAMEDCAIYAPYIAWTRRAHEREAIYRKLQGSVCTHQAMKVLKFGALAGGIMSMPIATAATAAGATATAAAGGAFVAASAVVVATALAVRAGLSYFAPDERISTKHPLLASVNSTAKAPAQHPDAVVTRLQLEKKQHDAVRKDAARVTGIAVDGQAPTVFAKNQDNTVAALAKRSAVLPAPFDLDDRAEFVTWSLKNWHLLVGKSFKIHTPDTPEEWLAWVLKWIEGSNSAGHVKERYEKVARDLAQQGIICCSDITPSQVYEWTKRDASVKLETVLKNADKSPRQILAATPEFVVLTAPFIKELTGVIRKAWKPTGCRVYAPGVGSKRLADAMTDREWDNMANLDFDGYDSSQGVQIADMEIAVCKRYHAPRAMLQLMEGNKSTHGASREGVKFKTPYVRNSGDPWTTLFNTVLNGVLMSFVYCRARQCDVRDMQARFFAGGDDGALFYDGERINFSSELARLGLPATVKHVANLHEVEFLSCRLTHTVTGWNFVPMVGKTIAKLGYSVRATTPHKAKQIARGAAQSMYAASHGCPPLRAYLDAVLRVTSDVKGITPGDEPWKMTAQDTGAPNAETWMHLGDIYGWSQSLQETLEARLATVKEAGTIINSPALEILIDRDTGRDDFLYARGPDHDLEEAATATPPAPRLVCVEENPGPTVRTRAPQTPQLPRQKRGERSTSVPTTAEVETLDRVYVAADTPVDAGDLALESRFSFTKAAARRAALRVDVPRDYPDSDTDEDSDRSPPTEFSRGCVKMVTQVIANRVTEFFADIAGLEDDGYDWSVSAKKRNKTQHALNGNRNNRQVKRGKRNGAPQRKPRARKAPQRPRARMPGPSMALQMGRSSDVQRYIRVLCDPWSADPVRLGGEMMQPTSIATLVYRGVVPLNSNGQLSIVAYPMASSGVLVSTTSSTGGGTTPYVYTANSYPNGASLIASSLGARVIAAGMRITSIANSTQDSGLLTIGCLPREVTSTSGLTPRGTPMTATTTATQGFNEFQNYAECEIFPLKNGAACVYRPQDPVDFTFRDTLVVNNTAWQLDEPLTPVFVAGISGGTSGSSVMIEITAHLEYTPAQQFIGIADLENGNISEQGLVDAIKGVFGDNQNTATPGAKSTWVPDASTMGRFLGAFARMGMSAVKSYNAQPNYSNNNGYGGKAYNLGSSK